MTIFFALHSTLGGKLDICGCFHLFLALHSTLGGKWTALHCNTPFQIPGHTPVWPNAMELYNHEQFHVQVKEVSRAVVVPVHIFVDKTSANLLQKQTTGPGQQRFDNGNRWYC